MKTLLVLFMLNSGICCAIERPSLKFNYHREELDGISQKSSSYSPGLLRDDFLGSIVIPLNRFTLTLGGGYSKLAVNRIYTRQNNTGAVICFTTGGCYQLLTEKQVNVEDIYSGPVYNLELRYEF